MSSYLLPRQRALDPYVPGEQPRDRSYIKLNTNENPFPPSNRVLDALSREAVAELNLYPDPTALALRQAIADEFGLDADNVFVGNGSDEVLGFSFMAYADETRGMTIPEVSYDFYKVYARLFRVTPDAVPLNKDFTIPVERFLGKDHMVALANPNAPTGLSLPLTEIERIVRGNPDQIVLIDEAYVDFGGESAVTLLPTCPNLLVVRTFSKSRSLAGGRLGFALAGKDIIDDLNRVKNSFHPYSVNRLTMAAGVEAMRDKAYFTACTAKIVAQREETKAALRARGFTVTDSKTNFLFAAAPSMSGEAYYKALKEHGILVRYLAGRTLTPFVRISIGTKEQMDALLEATDEILKGR